MANSKARLRPKFESMNVIILHCHSKEDGRIKRHIKFLISKGINVFVINFNISSNDNEVYSSFYGEKGTSLNYLWGSKVPIAYKGLFVLLNYYHFFGAKILKDTIKSLKILEFNIKTEPTILHVHDPMLLPLAKRLVCNEFGASFKIVYDRHEVYEKLNMFKYFGSSGYRLFEECAKNYISGVVSVSDSHVPQIREFFPDVKIKSVPNYPSISDYDVQMIENKIRFFDANSKINFVYIGSLANSYDRDVDLLIKIADNLLQRFSNCVFTVGGNNCDDVTGKKLQNMCNKFPEGFFYLGYVSRQKTIEITQNAHFGFFLLRPTNNYWVVSSPNKVFEYLVCGTVPIVRADVDNSNFLEKNFLLFHRQSHEEDIIKAVIKLVSDHNKTKELMTKARDSSNDFTWESVANNYIEIYNQIYG